MNCIEWEERFEIGVKDLDQHHMHLLDLLNRAYSTCMLNDPIDNLKSIIQELAEYTTYHFSAEELVMEENQYPGLCEQKKEHEIFIQKLAGLIQNIEKNEAYTAIELVGLTEFLTQWIRDHIINLDTRFGMYLNHSTRQ
jgi:hemerythrin-like metal-binding protein